MEQDMRMRCSFCGNPVEGEGEVCEDCKAEGRDRDHRELSRRKFLIGGVVGISGLIGVGYLGVLLKNLYPSASASSAYQNVGPLSNFTKDNYTLVTYTGQGFPDGVYVRQKAPGVIEAFDFHCAHLQCPVQWVGPPTSRFECPCHGSQYNINGQHVAGPAPRGLYPHAWKVENGNVYIGGQIG